MKEEDLCLPKGQEAALAQANAAGKPLLRSNACTRLLVGAIICISASTALALPSYAQNPGDCSKSQKEAQCEQQYNESHCSSISDAQEKQQCVSRERGGQAGCKAAANICQKP